MLRRELVVSTTFTSVFLIPHPRTENPHCSALSTSARDTMFARGHSWCMPAAAASAITSSEMSCTSQPRRTLGKSCGHVTIVSGHAVPKIQ